MKHLRLSVTRPSSGENLQITIHQSANGKLYAPLRTQEDAEALRRLSAFLAPSHPLAESLLVVSWDGGPIRTVVVERYTWIAEQSERRAEVRMKLMERRPALPFRAPARS